MKNGISLITKNTKNLSIFQKTFSRNFLSFSKINILNKYNTNNIMNKNFSIPNLSTNNSLYTLSTKMYFDNNDREVENEPGNEIYVRNLPWRVGDDQLNEFFSKFGEVVSARIPLNEEGNSRGFGFVRFRDVSGATNAVNEQYLKMEGRPIYVNYSRKSSERRGGENRNNRRNEREDSRNSRRNENQVQNPESNLLYVGNLSFDSSENSIKRYFGDCGEIVEVRLPMNQQLNRHRGFCIVEFDSIESCKKAAERNGQNLDGRTIRANFAKKREEREDNN